MVTSRHIKKNPKVQEKLEKLTNKRYMGMSMKLP